MAYKEKIGYESEEIQTSPAYVLTFLRYSNRDTVNYKNIKDSTTTRNPLVVINDAISITVSSNKNNPVHSMSCILKQGDINYLTAVAPGDYVLVNMVNWEQKAVDLKKRILAGKNINRKNDGFKGVFKVLNVNMNLSVGENGAKQYQVELTARGFDEFNSILYFNPSMPTGKDGKSVNTLFLNNFKDFNELVLKKDTNNIQQLVKKIISITMGQGISEIIKKENTQLNQVFQYKLPEKLPQLLGIKNGKYISDINKHYLGIWPKQKNGFSSFFKPEGVNNDKPSKFYNTGSGENQKIQGSRIFSFTNFQNINVWSLIQDYSNNSINESYTCYRLDPNGNVYPSLVVRQKPFNTNHFERFTKEQGLEKPPHVTKFLDLPRWEISSNIIKNLNIGRSDHARFNFIQVFSKSQSIDPLLNQTLQIVKQNYYEDKEDIIRSGRKPYILNAYFDYPQIDKDFRAREWALLVADWVLNGHLKMNGQIQTVGIEEPICIGDNLQMGDIVYHIESVQHVMSINPSTGAKTFKTNISLSYGVDERSTKEIPVYSEMEHTDSYENRLKDYNKERVLPGFSDTQDLPDTEGRVLGEEVKETQEESFTNPKAPSSKKGKKV